jgi:hypothetical protein
LECDEGNVLEKVARNVHKIKDKAQCGDCNTIYDV